MIRRLDISALLATLAVALLAMTATDAAASPWTLARGAIALTISNDFQFARREFLLTGEHQDFPVDGQFFSTNLRGELRYGITESLEIGGQVSLSYLAYESDEVYLGPAPGELDSFTEVRDNILSFDRDAAGIGDLYLFLRQRLTDPDRLALALELNLKLPTGYQPPEGFAEGQLPEGTINVLTLGDGQMDVTGLVLLGWAPPGGWLLRLDAGARLRLFGPGHQVVGALKVGRRVTDWWVPYATTDIEHSITEGEVLGQVLVTDSPDVPARDFNANLIRPIDLRLDRSVWRVGGGSIFRINDQEIDVSYRTVVWGENIAQLHILSLGTTFRLGAE